MNRSAFYRLGIVLALAAVPFFSNGTDVEPRKPGKKDTCPVCGMFVARHPEWLAQIVFDDGSAVFFDGAKDLFKYRLARGDYDPGRAGLEMAAAFVTGYYDLKSVPAQEAWYVVGSDVHGPMGPELVAHATRAAAEEFMNDHGGCEIVRFDEVDAARLRSLERAREAP